MSRDMCKSCPFKTGSVTQAVLDDWLDYIKEQGVGDSTVGCHMISDGQEPLIQPDPTKQCVGHRRYLEML